MSSEGILTASFVAGEAWKHIDLHHRVIGINHEDASSVLAMNGNPDVSSDASTSVSVIAADSALTLPGA